MAISLSRRRFLQSSIGSSALVGMGLTVPAFLARSATALSAQGKSGDRVLVVVQLSGGNDGLNTVVPYADPEYAKNRILLRIGPGEVLKIDDYLGLHPQMEGFHKLLEDGRLAIVQGVGYPNPNRSHFESMDIWHTATADVQQQRTGWLGRTLDGARPSLGQDVPAIYLGANELPLALVARQTPVPAVDSLETFRLQTAGGAVPAPALRKLASLERPDAPSLVDFIRTSTLHALDSSGKVQESLKADRSGVPYPGFGLARKLRNVAQLIDAGLKTRMYYLALDGFDTHAKQAEAHAGLLGELASSVRAFADDLAQRGHLDRVLVLAFSEFGRRVKENASAGTDHGAAAPVFLVGGQVQPGPIGKHPSLSRLDDEGDLEFHTDFRQVYATILDRWLGCSSETVLGGKYEHLAMLKA
jgi:uncharacterized protein (DUF1501 family)